MRQSERGFSLLELMIVIVIILVITTIATTNYRTQLKLANESAAVVELKSVHTAQMTYSASARTFGTIPDLIALKTLDPRFGDVVSGYRFSVKILEGGDYSVDAVPASSSTGRYAYYAGSDGIVMYSTEESLAPAGEAGKPIK